jgi:hypothetical protein
VPQPRLTTALECRTLRRAGYPNLSIVRGTRTVSCFSNPHSKPSALFQRSYTVLFFSPEQRQFLRFFLLKIDWKAKGRRYETVDGSFSPFTLLKVTAEIVILKLIPLSSSEFFIVYLVL